jgi:hypothetical protein
VCGAVTLLLVLGFLSQRGYTNPLASYFPDVVLITLAVLGVALVLRGLLWSGSAEGYPEAPNSKRLLAAVGLLAVWVLLVSPLGYLIGSILMFLAMSLFLRERPIGAKSVVIDGAVSVVVVGFLYLFFTRVLFVSLPPIPFT